MIALLFVLVTPVVQDTTIVIHADSSSASLEARALPKVVTDEVIRFYNDPSTTRLVGRTRLPHGNEWRGNVAVRLGPVFVCSHDEWNSFFVPSKYDRAPLLTEFKSIKE